MVWRFLGGGVGEGGGGDGDEGDHDLARMQQAFAATRAHDAREAAARSLAGLLRHTLLSRAFAAMARGDAADAASPGGQVAKRRKRRKRRKKPDEPLEPFDEDDFLTKEVLRTQAERAGCFDQAQRELIAARDKARDAEVKATGTSSTPGTFPRPVIGVFIPLLYQ